MEGILGSHRSGQNLGGGKTRNLGFARKERRLGQGVPMSAPVMKTERIPAKNTTRSTQLRGSDALRLYLAKIEQNLTALDAQTNLLRTTINETDTFLRETEAGEGG